MQFDVLTIFPQLFDAFRSVGVLGKAVDRGVVGIEAHDLRDWADNRWKQLDDKPYGGGAGMVLQAPPVLSALRATTATGQGRVIALSPRGRVLDQRLAGELAGEDRLVLLCGRYEGVDQRVLEHHIDEEWSIGDYVLSGGELPAMVLIDAIVRQLPGA